MWEARQIYSAEYRSITLVSISTPSAIFHGSWSITRSLLNFLMLAKEKGISKAQPEEGLLNSIASFRGSSVVERSPVSIKTQLPKGIWVEK